MKVDNTDNFRPQTDQKSKSALDPTGLWQFLEETSFHGCKNIGTKSRGVLYRLVWTLLVLGMLGGLLYTLAKSYIDFFKYKVTPRTAIEIHQEIAFPTITVCSTMPLINRGNTMSQTLKDYFAGGTIFEHMFPPWSGELSQDALRELEETKLKDVFDEYSVRNSEAFISSFRWGGSGNISFTAIDTMVGRCFTTSNGSAPGVKVTVEGRPGGLDMILDLNTGEAILTGDMTVGAMIFVHDPKENARTLQDGVMVGPGSASFINIKVTKYDFQPSPYKSYGNTYCEVTTANYSYEACVGDWAETESSYHCNCSGTLAPEAVQDELQPCSLKQFGDCYLHFSYHYLQLSLMSNFSVCRRPCSFSKYETSVSTAQFPSAPAVPIMMNNRGTNLTEDNFRKSIARVFIYIDRFIVNRVIYEPEVTINGIFSQLGGQMGFFLGASLLTVCELGEALLRLGWAAVRAMLGPRVTSK